MVIPLCTSFLLVFFDSILLIRKTLTNLWNVDTWREDKERGGIKTLRNSRDILQ